MDLSSSQPAYLKATGHPPGEMSFKDMLKVFFTILLAAMGISQARDTFPDITKASGAVQRVFSVIDRDSAIDIYNSGSEALSWYKEFKAADGHLGTCITCYWLLPTSLQASEVHLYGQACTL